MPVKTRSEFVTLRNAFFNHLNAEHSALAHLRVTADLMKETGCRNAENRAKEASDKQEEVEALAADYALLCEISAKNPNTQEDFDRAAAIAARWNIFPTR